jgi:methionyl-tRNA formyltransferase
LIYFGTALFAVPAMERLAHSIALVVSQPDRPSGRGMRMSASPVKDRALSMGLRVETPEKSRSPEFLDLLRSQDADALVVAAYGQILSTKVLESARCGGINLHGSILPKYRGAAPIQRAIEDGAVETGITLMQMDRGMDTGDMIAVRRTEIGPDETYGEVQDRLALLAGELAAEWMPRIVAGNYSRTPQDNSAATYAAKVEKAEAELRFEMDATAAYDRFRAFTPSPGAFINTTLGLIRLASMSRSDAVGQPGEIVATSPDLIVGFSGGALALREIQPEGKKRMTGRDFANGARLKPGMRLI